MAILVNNACVYDGRVVKQAESLYESGFAPLVVCRRAPGLPSYAKKNGVIYRRVLVDPGLGVLVSLIAKRVDARSTLHDDEPDRAASFWTRAVRSADAAREILRTLLGTRPSPEVAGLGNGASAPSEGEDRLAAVAVPGRASRVAWALIGRVSPRGHDYLSRLGVKLSRMDAAGAIDYCAAAFALLLWRGIAVRVWRHIVNVVNPLMLVLGPRIAFAKPVLAFEPDVIHSHDLDCLPAAVTLARAAHCPFIYDVHEVETHRPDRASRVQRLIHAYYERTGIRWAAGVVTVSGSLADWLRDRYRIARPTVVENAPRVSFGAPCSRSLREDIGLDRDTPLCIYVGNLALGRGLEHAVPALACVPGLHFALIGPPSSPRAIDELRKLAASVGALDRVHIVAPVSFDEVVPYIAQADFGIIPADAWTLNQKFGLPNKLCEMTLAGLPVIAVDVAERSAYLARLGNGILIPKSSVDHIAGGLARAMELVCNDRPRRLETARRARQMFNEMGWSRQMEKLLELYRKIGFDLEPAIRDPSGEPCDEPRMALAASWH
ncbi:MAG TPA: glycosyltransferase family 4 protein [Hyphomicrobiaceae bacterium]|nr:glycosyltransferase family 4 protein [Hyphomicrobiaceae bacterium]